MTTSTLSSQFKATFADNFSMPDYRDPDVLRKVRMLSELPPWQLEVVAEAVDVIELKKGKRLLERGSDDGHTYFLTEGDVNLIAAGEDASTVVSGSDTVKAPLANLRPRIFDVETMTRVQVIRVPDVVLSAAGCSRLGGPAITVESPLEEARHQAESRLSFHLYRDLKNDVAVLPSLPDLALRIRRAIDDETSDARTIARLVESDPAMAAKLLKAANSALYGGLGGVETTSSAVVRLGMQTTRQLVMTFALKEVFVSEDAAIRRRMQELWKHSAHIAALCFVLAREIKGLQAEEALLIGLVHDVGVIPIFNYADKYPELTEDPSTLDATIQRMRGELGAMILRQWHFPPEVVAAARDAENWTRRHNSAADFSDLVIVAQVHEFIRKHTLEGLPPLDDVSAIRRVFGDTATPEKSLKVLHDAKAQIDEMRSVLRS